MRLHFSLYVANIVVYDIMRAFAVRFKLVKVSYSHNILRMMQSSSRSCCNANNGSFLLSVLFRAFFFCCLLHFVVAHLRKMVKLNKFGVS